LKDPRVALRGPGCTLAGSTAPHPTQVARVDPQDEREASAWNEAVSDFDSETSLDCRYGSASDLV
jgi:hypothetical protein